MNSLEQPERFSRLPWPIHKTKAKSVGELFRLIPSLRRFFQKSADMNSDGEIGEGRIESTLPDNGGRKNNQGLVKLIKYIIFLYDPDSDLLDENPDDLRLRKEAAAKEAGFSRMPGTGLWSEWMEDVFNFRELDVNHLILDYLKVRKNHIWREIVFLEQELDNIYRIRTEDPDRALKEKLDQNAKIKREELSLLLKQFFDQHRDLKEATEDLLLPISPENAFKEMKLAPEVYQLKQIENVSANPGLHQEED